ncbi:hypothetical protein LQZ18_13635 [Lachnospiraceae bacterium ZAX-1]
MQEVLLVYKQIELYFDEEGNLIPVEGEKIKAIANAAPDMPPTWEHGFVGRDSECKRQGMVSLLTGMDLLIC